MVTLQPKDHFSQESQVTLHIQDGQQDLEFDSSAAQLVTLYLQNKIRFLKSDWEKLKTLFLN